VEDAALKPTAECVIDRRDPERKQGRALAPVFGYQGMAEAGQNRRSIQPRRRKG